MCLEKKRQAYNCAETRQRKDRQAMVCWPVLVLCYGLLACAGHTRLPGGSLQSAPAGRGPLLGTPGGRGPSVGCIGEPGALCWVHWQAGGPLLGAPAGRGAFAGALLVLCYGLLSSAGALLWSAVLCWCSVMVCCLCWWSAGLCCGPVLVTSHNTTIASSPLLCDMGNTATPCVTCVRSGALRAHVCDVGARFACKAQQWGRASRARPTPI